MRRRPFPPQRLARLAPPVLAAMAVLAGSGVAAAAGMVADAAPLAIHVQLPPPRPADLDRVVSLPRTAPLPPPDPRRQPAVEEATAPAGTEATPAAPSGSEGGREPPAEADACDRLLPDARVVARRLEPMGYGSGCGIPDPVQLEAVVLDDGRRVPIEPAPVMRCALAAAVADWARQDLAAIAAKAGAPLTRIANAAAYDCRGRNRVNGAKLSEHGRGNAIDIRSLTLADGRVLGIAPRGLPAGIAVAWRESACARFTTVLGPGSDGYHEEHLHVDLAARRNGLRLCRWTLQ
ncbi:extensin family protein [Chelatococcus sp. SYSU_G07232]|uniref:Extensin family protein n=1 Tax=Chelatococcus albus TaxID=3047466 RepID=A0ABT7AFW7_9HYPH|nr:extensin family protein [Chelatococcus sp. SYSU_G07232]